MINITYIYLIENIDNDPYKVYIGKTKNLLSRKSNHKRTYGDHMLYNVIDQINSIDRNEWEPLESYWIRQFKCWGFDVVNQNEGGGGSSTRIITWGDKIGKSNKGKPKPKGFGLGVLKPNSGAKGKPKPKGFGEKISKYRSGLSIPNKWIPIIQYDKKFNYINEWPSGKIASNTLNISNSNITNCCKGKLKSAGGFIWKYKVS